MILEAIREAPIRSQEELRRRIRSSGFDVTQATLSRDIREMGLVKGGADGAYRAPQQTVPNGTSAESRLQRAVAEQLLRVDRVQQLVLVRTQLGHAQSLCAALDTARLPDIVGTLAGEDTILIIAPDVRRAKAVVKTLEEMAKA